MTEEGSCAHPAVFTILMLMLWSPPPSLRGSLRSKQNFNKQLFHFQKYKNPIVNCASVT